MIMRDSPVNAWNAWPALEGPRWRPSSLLTILFVGGLMAGSWHVAQVEPGLLLGSQGRRAVWALATGLCPPNASPAFLSCLPVPALDTIQTSIMGTVSAIALGSPLALLATERFSFTGILYEMEKGA